MRAIGVFFVETAHTAPRPTGRGGVRAPGDTAAGPSARAVALALSAAAGARSRARSVFSLPLCAVLLACAATPASSAAQEPNTLTAAEREAGWKLLFDGRSLDGWRRYDGGAMTGGWVVEEGTLAHVRGGRSIITEEIFENFELTVEWKVGPGGNSGVFYRAPPGAEEIFHSAPELQILDDAGHADGQSPLTSAGSNYGLHGVPRGIVHPAGEWNQVGIVVRGTSVEHWLNGEKVVEYELGSPDWQAKVAASKFAEWPVYGQASRGHIGLQDHGNRVWFRNIKLREMP